MKNSCIKVLLISILLFTGFLTFGQNSNASKQTDVKDDKLFILAEVEPEFPGGSRELNKFIGSNLKLKPFIDSNWSGGKFILQFIVEKDGSITSFKNQNLDALILEEVNRVISLMPKWKPASQNGINVRFLYKLPVPITSER